MRLAALSSVKKKTARLNLSSTFTLPVGETRKIPLLDLRRRLEREHSVANEDRAHDDLAHRLEETQLTTLKQERGLVFAE